MNILAVDTSSDSGSVVIAAGGGILGEVRLAASMQYSERLFHSIDFLFAHAGLAIEDIDLFAAARGPGSFTGLRVGLAAVEGFAFATGKPSAGISTLAALAWQIGPDTAGLVPMIDARRGEIYGAVYARRAQRLEELRSPEVRRPEEWFDSLPPGPLVFCGPAAAAHRSRIEGRPEWRLEAVSPYLAASVAEMVRTPNREPLEPLYIRRTMAEVNREMRGTR